MASFLDRILGRISGQAHKADSAGSRESAGAPDAEEEVFPLLDESDEFNPMLARRLTELESTMASLAQAHADALKAQTALQGEVARLKHAPEATPEAQPEIPKPSALFEPKQFQ